jgi:hypothetical protein
MHQRATDFRPPSAPAAWQVPTGFTYRSSLTVNFLRPLARLRFKNLAAGLCRHAGTETVHVLPLPNMRLKRPLHISSLSSLLSWRQTKYNITITAQTYNRKERNIA